MTNGRHEISAHPLKRSRSAHGLGAITFTPFLDMIMATTAIFLLIFAIESLQREPITLAPEPDQVVACVLSKEYQLFSKPGSEAQVFSSFELSKLVDEIFASANGALNILFVYGPGCVSNEVRFVRAMERHSRELADRTAINRSFPRIERWPLPSDPMALNNLLEQWSDTSGMK